MVPRLDWTEGEIAEARAWLKAAEPDAIAAIGQPGWLDSPTPAAGAAALVLAPLGGERREAENDGILLQLTRISPAPNRGGEARPSEVIRDADVHLAGQALAHDDSRTALARLAHSVRLKPANNPATAALVFMLAYQNYPWPLGSADVSPDLSNGQYGFYLAFSKDGNTLFLPHGKLDLATFKLEEEPEPRFDWPASDKPISLAGFIAMLESKGRFMGKPVGDEATTVASADGSRAMDWTRNHLTRNEPFAPRDRLSAEFPGTLACAFHPTLPNRLATASFLPPAPGVPAVRIHYWDITPSAVPAVDERTGAGSFTGGFTSQPGRSFVLRDGSLRTLARSAAGDLQLRTVGTESKLLWECPRSQAPADQTFTHLLSLDGSVLLVNEMRRHPNRDDDETQYLVRTRDGKVLETYQNGGRLAEAWNRGETMAFILGQTLHRYDTRKEQQISSREIASKGLTPVGPEGSLFIEVSKIGDDGVVHRAGTPAERRGFHEMRVYSATDDKVTATLRMRDDDPSGTPYFAVINPAGNRLVTGDRLGNASVFSYPDGKPLFVLPIHHREFKDVGCDAYFHPSGRLLYLINYGTEADRWDNAGIDVWDMERGKHISEHQLSVECFPFSSAPQFHRKPLVFSQTGQWMVSCGEDSLTLLDSAAAGRIFSFQTRAGGSLNDEVLDAILALESRPAPDWLAELAELMAGRELAEEGFVRDTLDAFNTQRLMALRERIEKSGRDDFLHRWGLWFLNHQDNRGPFPNSR
jgi:hypothetical protein